MIPNGWTDAWTDRREGGNSGLDTVPKPYLSIESLAWLYFHENLLTTLLRLINIFIAKNLRCKIWMSLFQQNFTKKLCENEGILGVEFRSVKTLIKVFQNWKSKCNTKQLSAYLVWIKLDIFFSYFLAYLWCNSIIINLQYIFF